MRYLMTAALGLSLLMWNVIIPGMALAEDTETAKPANETTTIETEDQGSFDLGILSTEGQGQKYFEGEGTPVVNFILDVINFITQILGAVAMILIIIGGIMMIVSQGNEDLLQKGKGVLSAAIFGLVVAMFSYIIVRFVQSLFYLEDKPMT